MRDGIKSVLENQLHTFWSIYFILPEPATFQKKPGKLLLWGLTTNMANVSKLFMFSSYVWKLSYIFVGFLNFDDVDLRPEVIIHVQDIC